MRKNRIFKGLLSGAVSALVLGSMTMTAGAEQENAGLSLWMSDYEQEIFAEGIAEFQEKYPDIPLELEVYPAQGELLKSQEKMQIQLMAGDGPDLMFFSSYGTDDVYKLMKAQVFAPLDEWMAEGGSWDGTQYITAVTDAGKFDGTQYVMPFTYRMTTVLTSKEALEAAELSESDLGTTLDFMKSCAKLYETDYQERILAEGSLTVFPSYLGGDLLDYTEGCVGVDSQVLREACEAYQKMYEEGLKAASFDQMWYGYGKAIGERRAYFYCPTDLTGLFAAATALAATEQPVFLPLRTVDGEITANVGMYAGIRANSENKENAWNMLRILLGEAAQKKLAEKRGELPVSKAASEAAVRAAAEEAWLEGMSMMEVGELSEEFLDGLRACVDNPDRTVFVNKFSVDVFHENMEPFYLGTDSYENCLGKFENYIKIYLTE